MNRKYAKDNFKEVSVILQEEKSEEDEDVNDA